MTTTLEDRDLRVALADASLDAPRVDLWQRLEQPVQGMSRPSRKLWSGVRAMAAMLAVLLVGAGMMAVVSQVAPQRESVARGGSVPDLLLMQSYDQKTQSESLQAYLPGSNQLLSVVDGLQVSGAPVISPDGRQLVYEQRMQVGDEWQVSVLALASDTLAPQWVFPVGTQSAQITDQWLGATYALTAERVYVASFTYNAADPLTIVALDREDGHEVQRWKVDLAGAYLNGLTMRISPDGDTLHLLPVLSDQQQTQMSSSVPTLGYMRFSLPDMREQQRRVPLPSKYSMNYWFDHQTPDGSALWGFSYGGGTSSPLDSGLGVVFFDTASATIDGPLPIDLGDNIDWLYEHAVSADGSKLYVFNPVNGRLTIVDLIGRQVVQEVDVDMSRVQSDQGSLLGRVVGAVRGWFVEDSSAKYYMQGTMQFSPDGSRLYALGATGSGYEAQPSGVLAIDTTNWQVLEHWLPDSNPDGIILGSDGRYLYAHSVEWSSTSGKGSLTAIDTTTGEATFAVDAGSGAIYSTVELYQDRYGKRPDVGDARTASKSTLAKQKPFASLRVTASADTIVAGDTVTIEARFVDPQSGDVVTEGGKRVIYSPPDHVRAVLTRGSNEDSAVTVVLTNAGYGVYHGSALLTEPGVWDVRVISERAGEPSRRVALTGGVTVQPAFAGTDGRRYMLVVSTDPATPAVDQPVTVTVSFHDVETGAAMPDGVSLTGHGLPDSMAASFFGNGGVTSATLTATGHGVYAGTAKLFGSGTWTAQVNFPQDGAPSRSVQAGVIVVP